MSQPEIPEVHITTSLSSRSGENDWMLTRSVDPSHVRKTSHGARIIVSHEAPPEGAGEDWPMTLIRFIPVEMAAHVLEPSTVGMSI